MKRREFRDACNGPQKNGGERDGGVDRGGPKETPQTEEDQPRKLAGGIGGAGRIEGAAGGGRRMHHASRIIISIIIIVVANERHPLTSIGCYFSGKTLLAYDLLFKP